MKLTEKRRAVLAELEWLCTLAPSWARDANDGCWQAFHVRWFRSAKQVKLRPELGVKDPVLATMSVPAIGAHLRELARAGLAERSGPHREYRITEAGREALRADLQ